MGLNASTSIPVAVSSESAPTTAAATARRPGSTARAAAWERSRVTMYSRSWALPLVQAQQVGCGVKAGPDHQPAGLLLLPTPLLRRKTESSRWRGRCRRPSGSGPRPGPGPRRRSRGGPGIPRLLVVCRAGSRSGPPQPGPSACDTDHAAIYPLADRRQTDALRGSMWLELGPRNGPNGPF